MGEPATGRCLCGAVSFEVTGAFEGFFLCHCSRCRRGTGSAHAANLFSSTAQLVWLTGERSAKRFRLAGTRHERCFCAECGAALPYVEEESGWVVIPAGSLDGPVLTRPDAHICWASRADWDEGLDAVARIDGLPE
ncbi:GFA family protein [Litorisediminicola beolgyonensis]|uniref:GFA family protein n=1 Tax=Litorisediminicola beolgyonensis TaxID=1173614 RepID=A0ABW3ZGB5_9RHOB